MVPILIYRQRVVVAPNGPARDSTTPVNGEPSTRAVSSPLVCTLRLALGAAVLALLILAPPARAQTGIVAWIGPTPADNARLTVTKGKVLTLTLAAATSGAAQVSIDPVAGLPPGATFSLYADNGTSRAVFRRRPTEVGDYTLGFAASAGGPSITRTYRIRVNPDIRYPHSYALTDARIGHWARRCRQGRSSARGPARRHARSRRSVS